MKRAFRPWLGLLVVVLVSGAGAWLYAGASLQQVHPLGSSCSSCHLAGDATTSENASMLVASQEELCSQCHRDSMQMSHRSGFAPPPGVNIPLIYPLDWKGELTCSTCHSVHSVASGKLRGIARGPALCLGCHPRSFFDDMPDGGSSLTPSGHLGSQNSRNWRSLDQYSIQCLSCHEANGDVNLDSNQIVGNHGSQSHPVGRSYSKASLTGGYRPASFLSGKIKLPNDMVSCISCHEGYSKVHGKLVMDNAGSKLCFECHDL